jgi:hypothetical protein
MSNIDSHFPFEIFQVRFFLKKVQQVFAFNRQNQMAGFRQVVFS